MHTNVTVTIVLPQSSDDIATITASIAPEQLVNIQRELIKSFAPRVAQVIKQRREQSIFMLPVREVVL
jgi:hypothetical protein